FRLREGDPSLWKVALPAAPTRNPLKWVWRRLRALPQASLRLRNYRALRPLAQRSEDWAILNSNYHDYLTLMHYLTLPSQRAQLVEAGFEADAIAYTSEGVRLSDSAPDAFMLHLMARVPKSRS